MTWAVNLRNRRLMRWGTGMVEYPDMAVSLSGSAVILTANNANKMSALPGLTPHYV